MHVNEELGAPVFQGPLIPALALLRHFGAKNVVPMAISLKSDDVR